MHTHKCTENERREEKEGHSTGEKARNSSSREYQQRRGTGAGADETQ
jgi:hypothetical protein